MHTIGITSETSVVTPSVRRKESPGFIEFTMSIVVSLMCITTGFIMQWSPPEFVHTDGDDQPFFIPHMEEVSFLVVAPEIVGSVASLVFGYIAYKHGRKPALYVSALFGALSGYTFIFAEGPGFVYFGRIASSICMAGAAVICPVYVIEMVRRSARGIFVPHCASQIFVGVFLGGGMGAFLNYTPYCAFLIIFPSSFIFIFFWLPESPYYFVGKSKLKHAELSLGWMRGRNFTKYELNDIMKEFDKPVSVSVMPLILYVIRGLGGIYVIQHYIIVISITYKSIPIMCNMPIALSILVLISSFLGALATNFAGRKLLLYMSYGGAACSFLINTIYKFLKIEFFPWLPIFGVGTSVVFIGIGYGTLTPLVALEMTDVRKRCFISSIGTALEFVTAFSAVIAYPYNETYLCGSINFMIPAITNAIGVFLTWLVITETEELPSVSVSAPVASTIKPAN